MKIALFDIDGTLTASNDIDSICFADAYQDVFGITIDSNWDSYQHTTDRGIVSESLRKHYGREPAEEEIGAHRRRFVELLELRMTRLQQIAGAGAFVVQLLARDWRIALCTGAWSESARLKLSRAGFPLDLPLASCDDDISREAILLHGIALAGGTRNDIVVSFGDAPWDVRAAANLRLPFVAIASGTSAQTLRRMGADAVFEDFRDAAAVFAALDRITSQPKGSPV
jgi:beta-phosphoglucomutase-like phosphatase (HAD superfamily)